MQDTSLQQGDWRRWYAQDCVDSFQAPLTGDAAREVQEVRLWQMSPRHVRITTAPAHGPIRCSQHFACQTILFTLRRPLQPQIFTTRYYRRCLLRHVLPQHPLPSIPRDAATEVAATI